MLAYFWWIAAAIFFVAEIFTPEAVLVFAGLSAVCVAILDMLGVQGIFVQGTVFVILSTILTYYMRPFWMRLLNNKDLKTGASALIGQEVRVIEDINHQKLTGRVKIGADEFPAKSVDDSVILAGRFATVKKIQGITLIVSQKEVHHEK
ncbi:Membrane protein implicated in regulation of membrane protease activity [Brevinema andersonii]|uniref:Membrane protein implicated in regulation of membrane protease activity n=1 Tax=Brevinema andersonii TaxID=34097 RepID=A0A1I1FA69_BREAD|nr:NfeD family protein [Brevinema andersonii]SFB96267.1 Membrane protein implicated in regulation of membrane protease activity [Brevinema andersonii]